MEKDSSIIVVMVGAIFMAIFLVFALAKLNNKLYDIRELLNGTCRHENSYNGVCH